MHVANRRDHSFIIEYRRPMETLNKPALGILFILVGTLAISVNDLLIKYLSDGYPLHQMIFTRSVIGLCFTFTFVYFEGGLKILHTKTPVLHALRGLMVVAANLFYYAAMAVMPLGQVTALFFVAPLFITLMSIPFLGEKVGPLRIFAVLIGLAGVVIMQQPWNSDTQVSRVVMLLPVVSAAFYASMQVMTRKLGVSSAASAMAVYMQSTFLVVSLIFFLVAGDGRFAEGQTNESMIFMFRAWTVPPAGDWPVFIGLGVCSGVIGYCLTAAYRLANAATVAPFEYVGLPLAILWGWLVFGEWPTQATWVGCALIIGAGLFVFLREQSKSSPQPGRRSRWGRR